jgi:N-formylglutamate amidohydrolase
MSAHLPNPSDSQSPPWKRGSRATVMDREPALLDIAESPVIVHVPHAGGLVPQATPLPPVELLREQTMLLADRHTDLVADLVDFELTRRGGSVANRVTNVYSRVFMDPERFDSEEEEMNQVGMGVVYTKTHDGRDLYDPPIGPEEVQRRKAKYFLEYASRFAALTSSTLAEHGRCLIVDLHSYTPQPLPHERHQDEARPPVCLGFDSFHAPDAEGLASALAASGFATAMNQPFHGSYVPLPFYGTDRRVRSVMVEIRRDVYLDRRGDLRAAEASRLAATLAAWIDTWVASA